MSSLVIVRDKYLEVNSGGQVQGLLRVVLYLEDMGVASAEAQKRANSNKPAARAAPGQAAPGSSGANPVED